MNIKNQVLSIEQVRELQELGFDVRKHSSMYYTPNWITKFGVDEIQDYLLQIGGLDEDDDGDCIPTLTIGDILEVLPLYIKGKRNNTYWRVINYNGILYYRPKPVDWVFTTYYEKPNKHLIEALFEALKWCIKEKHINLK